jgi:hypothetical protein
MLTTGEASYFKAEQALSMNDVCTIYTYAGNATGTDGQLSPYYTTGTSSCGFRPVRSGKVYRGQIVYPEYDAELRTPTTLLVDTRSIFVVNGELYNIDGLNAGHTANLYNLKYRETE